MTSLNRDEFERLRDVFEKVWYEKTEQDKKDPAKGGRKPILHSAEDRLFFILFYLKTYPLQEVLAHLFGMSQGQANFLIYQLSEILKETFKRLGHLPARLPKEMLNHMMDEEPQDLGIDGTERRIERPTDPDRQKKYYSGKKSPYAEKRDCRRVK